MDNNIHNYINIPFLKMFKIINVNNYGMNYGM